MSNEFWLGMFCIPAAAWAIFTVFTAIVATMWVSERVDLSSWKIWPKSADDRLRNRETLVATVACAKWVRYLWIPGWHIVICRTTLYRPGVTADIERHRLVQRAVREVLDDISRDDS